jgi:hypothetical protein
MKDPDQKDKDSLKEEWENAKSEVKLEEFKSGTWFINLIRKCFHNYYERATSDYFSAKYPGFSEDKLLSKITKVAARNTAIVGGLVGLAVSADEVLAFFTALPTAGLAVPAQVAIAATAIAAELLVITRMQLKLVAEIAKIMKVPLNPEDPEDILTILAFAVGGGTAEAAGKMGMKVGAKVTEKVIKATIKKETLAALKSFVAKFGLKLLQRTIIKYAVPGVSIAIGFFWNMASTKTVSRIAREHFEKRRSELRQAGTGNQDGADGSVFPFVSSFPYDIGNDERLNRADDVVFPPSLPPL